MTLKQSPWKRRAILAGGGLAIFAWVKGAPHLASLGKADLAFEPLPDLVPFRRLASAGPATSGAGLFSGLEAQTSLSDDDLRLDRVVRSDPCAAFYGPDRRGPVPVAVFSDFACPNCRVMDARIAELQAGNPGLFRIIHHQLPILGAASATASRAVLAAARQGAYDRMHARLIRTPAVTDISFVTRIAASLGLDPDQFRADIVSKDIDHALRLSAAIARVFGFYGTPAFAVGRTVFMGAVPKSTLSALIAAEEGNPCHLG